MSLARSEGRRPRRGRTAGRATGKSTGKAPKVMPKPMQALPGAQGSRSARPSALLRGPHFGLGSVLPTTPTTRVSSTEGTAVRRPPTGSVEQAPRFRRSVSD